MSFSTIVFLKTFINENLDTILRWSIFLFHCHASDYIIKFYNLILLSEHNNNEDLRIYLGFTSWFLKDLKLVNKLFELGHLQEPFKQMIHIKQTDSQKNVNVLDVPTLCMIGVSLIIGFDWLRFTSTYGWPLTPSSAPAHQPSHSPSGERTGTQCAVVMGTRQRRFITGPVLHSSGQRAAREELDGSFCIC